MTFLMNFSVVLVLLLSSFFSETHAHVILDRSSCAVFYKEHKVFPFGRRAWFRNESRAIGDENEPKYKPKGQVVELKEAKVTNQCETSECYLFAAINFINTYNKHNIGTAAPMVSEPFLVAHKFLEHIKETLRLGTVSPENIHDLEGGFPYEAFHLTREVGMIPKTAWTPKIPLEKWDMTKIYQFLGKKVPEHHKVIAKLAKKSGSWTSKEVTEALEKSYSELAAIVLEFSGPLPTEFSFKGERYTPNTFEQRFGVPRLSTFYLHNSGEFAIPENYSMVLRQAFTKHGGRYRAFDDVGDSRITSIRSYIDKGLPVIIDLNWRDDGHSMLVVGYEVNDTNEIVRFKTMNSWGSWFGNNGYAWYTPADVIKNTTGTYRIDLN